MTGSATFVLVNVFVRDFTKIDDVRMVPPYLITFLNFFPLPFFCPFHSPFAGIKISQENIVRVPDCLNITMQMLEIIVGASEIFISGVIILN